MSHELLADHLRQAIDAAKRGSQDAFVNAIDLIIDTPEFRALSEPVRFDPNGELASFWRRVLARYDPENWALKPGGDDRTEERIYGAAGRAVMTIWQIAAGELQSPDARAILEAMHCEALAPRLATTLQIAPIRA